MPVYPLTNPVRAYAWGAEDFIPRLLGREPVPGQPVAELWLGAHPASPSRLVEEGCDLPLTEFICRNPLLALGERHNEFADTLPFLLKILAVKRPLSIQAHPSAASARLGFERENSLGIPLDSSLRNYRDPNPKPELICALTPFRALCGFRPYSEIIGNFRELGLGSHLKSFAAFAKFADQRSFQRFTVQLLSLPADQAAELNDALMTSLRQNILPDSRIAAVCATLFSHYPVDPGVLAPLYLRIFDLAPGEALYLGAGVLHSYLEGAGVEIMSNSDNVLRGGLTPKHIDVPELASILDFAPYEGDRITARSVSSCGSLYPTPAKEFSLLRYRLEEGKRETIASDGLPCILLCDEGGITVWESGSARVLEQGDSMFVTASAGDLTLTGAGSLWLATVPRV